MEVNAHKMSLFGANSNNASIKPSLYIARFYFT